MNLLNRSLPLIGALLVIGGCRQGQERAEQTTGRESGPREGDPRCATEARRVVEQLGSRMRRVSLLAPDSVVQRELRDAYADLVTSALLASWTQRPTIAPGRRVSSPWPARVDIDSITPEDNHCIVKGDVVYVTSADTTSPVDRREVTMRVIDERGWRVSAYDEASSATAELTTASPADVVRRYYAAIQARNYGAAYAMWSEAGRASGQTPAEFRAGFAETERIRLTIGDSVRVEGAAGSQYATVPVAIDAALRNDDRQHFEGSYTLRRSMVDGATPDQRRWHIYAADLRRK